MREHREQTQAVIDDDGVTGEVQVAGHRDVARIRCVNRRAGRTQEVGAAMCVARLAVEDATRSERTIGWFRYRPHEGSTPQSSRGRGVPGCLEERRFPLDARLLGFRRRHEGFVY